jgi:hypothetical protein
MMRYVFCGNALIQPPEKRNAVSLMVFFVAWRLKAAGVLGVERHIIISPFWRLTFQPARGWKRISRPVDHAKFFKPHLTGRRRMPVENRRLAAAGRNTGYGWRGK